MPKKPSTSKRFLISNAQYFPPSGSIITLDPERVSNDETAFLLAGFIPQNLALRCTRIDWTAIRIENIGSLPVTWCVLDNPYRPETIVQTPILPGEELNVPYVCGHSDRMYLTTTAFDVNVRSGGKLFPVVIRIRVELSNDGNLHIEFE